MNKKIFSVVDRNENPDFLLNHFQEVFSCNFYLRKWTWLFSGHKFWFACYKTNCKLLETVFYLANYLLLLLFTVDFISLHNNILILTSKNPQITRILLTVLFITSIKTSSKKYDSRYESICINPKWRRKFLLGIFHLQKDFSLRKKSHFERYLCARERAKN